MSDKWHKIWNLILAPNVLERFHSLLEIRFNNLFFPTRSQVLIKKCSRFMKENLKDYQELAEILRTAGEAENIVEKVRNDFDSIKQTGSLPFPIFFNADKSFAMLCYAFARYLKPTIVIETGVGYGIISSVLLHALEKNNQGHLYSIDLPSLSDPKGFYTGIVIPNNLKHRWTLYLGSSRKMLPEILNNIGNVSLFISDSANVYTLQKYEFQTIWPVLSNSGATIFNNINDRAFIQLRKEDISIKFIVQQTEKIECVTAVIIKK